MNGCSVPRRFFRVHQGMHSASPHYQRKTQPNQNGDKTEKKQEMAATAFKGEHNPVVLALKTNGEIRLQNGIYNSHANCQAVEA